MELKQKKRMSSLAEAERETSLAFKFAYYEKARVLMTLKDKGISTREQAEQKEQHVFEGGQ
jgi:hypothetical protein